MKISGALKEVERSAPSVINVLAYIGIGALVMGIITQLDSTVTVSSALGTFLNTTLGTNSVTAMTAVVTVLTTVVSLIVVGVLWKLFGLGKKGKGKGM